jgi:sulfonate transport system substrate-binding protein
MQIDGPDDKLADLGATTSRRRFLAHSGATAALLFAPMRKSVAATSSDTILKIGDQKGGSQAVMEAAGVLRDLPYRVEWKQFPAAAPLLEALNAGAIDSGFAGDAPTTFAFAAGAPAKIIGANRSNPRATAIIVPKTAAIRTPADLKGKIIGTGRGSIGHYLVLAALKAAGLTTADVKIAFLLPSDAKMALARGAIDAWSTWGIYTAQAVLIEGARIVADGGDGLLSGLSYQSATIAAIAAKRDALADFVRRLAGARLWALDNVDSFSRTWAQLVGVDLAVAKYSIGQEGFRPVAIDDTVISDQQKTADLWTESGVVARKLDVRPFFDSAFNTALSL